MELYNKLVDVLQGERLIVIWNGDILTHEEAAARISNRLDDQ